MASIPRESREYAAPRLFDRALDLSWINLEVLAFALLMALSVLAHLWALDVKAMHHDESIHAWSSWRLYTAAGSFNCAGNRVAPTYCYDPVYHGPSLYHLTTLAYFLFGDGEWQARLPMAAAGILLTASAWLLRPYLGPRGTFVAAALLTFSPSLLYFTRFARHDALMLLWVLWMVIGFFRFLDSGRARYLYLLAAGTALAMATHELYYILFFLFGAFVLVRALTELLPHRSLMFGLTLALALAFAIMGWNPAITPRLQAGGLALLFGTVVGVGLLLTRVWDPAPVLLPRARALWQEQRGVLWTALAILATIFILEYSNFLTDPLGILDGLYRGIQYWLGSQHEYARGKQPWYYYLMLLPVYEPLGLLGAASAAAFLFAWGRARVLWPLVCVLAALIIFASGAFGSVGFLGAAALVALAAYLLFMDWQRGRASVVAPAEPSPATADDPSDGEEIAEQPAEMPAIEPVEQAPAPEPRSYAPLFPLFLAFWFVGALVAFSWAGEKMPWLLTHIALPANLLAAWAIGRLLDAGLSGAADEQASKSAALRSRIWLVPAALLILLVALGAALSRISASGEGLAGQTNLLQALVPLLIGGLMIFALLTIGQQIGARATLTAVALTLAGVLAAYTIRAAWLVNYDHPDTPIEALIYVQSTPDVPLIVRDIRTLAINQTRNNRNASDPAGGHTMPVIMDVGDDSGEGSLAWPYQWYLRDFQRIEGRKADFFRNATAESFEVAADARQPDGDKVLAPVVMVYVPHMTEQTRQALDENYVKKYASKLNWYFPEGDLTGCDPRVPGYKRFYYSTQTIAQAKADTQCQSLDVETLPYASPFAPLIWPFQPENWSTVKGYLLYRTLPDPLRIDGREMEVWVRKDLAGGGGTAEPSGASGNVFKLVAQQVLGSSGHDAGQLDQPRGAAVDAQGNVYVADLGNSRVQVFGPNGQPARTIGAFGGGDGQFNEPRGVAVDAQGNLYVADTWNARVQKFDASGKFLKSWGSGADLGGGRRATMNPDQAANDANPLGFFGPRAVAVDAQGNVYIADTGNKRVVVTDGEGKYLYQWGHAGNEPGAFNEPIGLAVDAQGSVYVADTWNGRVQVFARGQDGRVGATPQTTWRVPGWQPNTYDDPYIAVNPSGQVFASVPSRNLMLQFAPGGDVLLRWGGKGSDTASFSFPSGVAVAPNGDVYVVDRANNRALRFQVPSGTQ